MQDAFAKGGKNVEYHDYYKYRISYITEKDLELMFLFVTGLTDNFENIKKELIKCKKQFLNLFEDILQHKFDAKTFEIFDPTIDSIHRNLRPKISLVGFSGVGKTTITRLIKAEEIPMEHIPTITGDIATIKIGKLHFHLWDFAGQEQFSYLWNNFIKGSDAVLLITDSTLENIEKSKFFLELIKEQAAQAHTSVIGNKQDLDDALKPEQIEKILGLKTYSMVAKDSGNRNKMITIIADILEMSAEVSPLLKPLLERDNYTEEAVKALESGRFEDAAMFFEKISDLCLELGDDSLGKEFYEKSEKIKAMLKAANTPQTQPVQEPPKPIKEPPKPIEGPPKIKKPTLPDSPKVEGLVKPKIPTTTPQFIHKKVEVAEKKSELTEPAKPIEEKKEVIQKENEPEMLIQPKIFKTAVGLNLNPADFMVKQRPKSVTVVPKDAKNKLKTSPFAHVSNPTVAKKPILISPTELVGKKMPSGFVPPVKDTPPKIQKAPKIPTPKMSDIPKKPIPPPIPVSPTTLIKKPPKVAPPKHPKESIVKTQPDVVPSETTVDMPKKAVVSDAAQKAGLEKSLMDLKINRANITKMSLDFDMKELTGEITGDELEEKKKKLSTIEKNINEQIKETEKLLGR